MGWLWSSTAPTADTTAPATPQPASAPARQPVPEPPATRAKPLTRDELADQELQSFLDEIASETNDTTPKKKPKYQRSSRLPHPGATESPELSLEDSLYPTTMSCREAFDAAFYCQSLGGQFNSLYRYGGMQSCSEHWRSFWFCMRTKSLSGVDKEKMVREHYRGRAAKYREGPSSEDVWVGRERRLGWGEAFAEGVGELLQGESDEEWNVRERKRREGRKAGTI